jgi:2,4-dienoyl-CoA reductase-like NADH-dependent reductase (Old Yellow Enzyme family)
MTDKLSRRKFLKTGIAATTAVLAGPRLTGADKDSLFERSWIKSLELRNRTVKSSTWSGTGDQKGYVTDRTIDFYGELARGDIGLILTGYQYVMTNGMSLPYMVGNYEDTQAEGLKKLVETVHRGDGKIAAQLVHCLARANTKLFFKEGDELWGASAIPYSAVDKVPKEMTQKDIAQLVEAHAAAASRCQKCGFDGIQLHGAHGYGVNQFLSPAWNRRGDMYGGSFQNRYRLVGEIIEAIRGKVGKDFPVMFKLSAQDFVEGGLELSESVEIARRLADDGIDAIQVSACCSISCEDKHCTKRMIVKEEDEAYLADFAQYIKERIKVPIIVVGGIRSVPVIDGILKERRADYISMARPFIREPHLIKRWKGGDATSAKCISCNRCFETGMEGLGISCYWERMLKEERQKT